MRRLTLPKSIKDLLDPQRQADLREAVRILNALQNLRLVINSGGQQSAVALQRSGPTGLLSAQASLASTLRAQVLVVASGGGGSWFGGGGAGELVYRPSFLLDQDSYAVVLGAGGPGGSQFVNGTNGHGASFGGSLLVAQGGGGGGSQTQNGSPGGSGGGGGANTLLGQVFFGGVSTASMGYGFAGGSTPGQSGSPCGGGGGAGAHGGNGSSGSPTGVGGVGRAYDISGTMTYYAGGGGCGAFVSQESPGGLGGGGDGKQGPTSTGLNGTNGLGGGGGGGGTGGNGGTGVVIVRYPGPQRFTGGTITHVGLDVVHTFTSSGTLAKI